MFTADLGNTQARKTILSCPLFGDHYIRSFSSMVDHESDTYRTIAIGHTVFYISPGCQLSDTLASNAPRMKMTPEQRLQISNERDESGELLVKHLHWVLGEMYTENRFGPLIPFVLTLTRLYDNLMLNGDARTITNLFATLADERYAPALATFAILHKQGHLFKGRLSEWMSFYFQGEVLKATTVHGNQNFTYSSHRHECTVTLNRASPEENALPEFMVLMSNIERLGAYRIDEDIAVTGQKVQETPVEEPEDLLEEARRHILKRAECDTRLPDDCLTDLSVDRAGEMTRVAMTGDGVTVHLYRHARSTQDLYVWEGSMKHCHTSVMGTLLDRYLFLVGHQICSEIAHAQFTQTIV